MEKLFTFIYFMKNEHDRIKSVVPQHVKYWKDEHLPGYSGGPFADRSGGLITFKAESFQAAREAVNNDPFVKEDVLETRWLKEWTVE